MKNLMNRNELEQRVKVVLQDQLTQVSGDQAMAELWQDVLGSPAIGACEGGVLIKSYHLLQMLLRFALDRLVKEMPSSQLAGLLREYEEKAEVLEESLDDCE